MSHPVYSQQSLALLSPAALKVIAKAIGIKEPAFRKATLIPQILEHQAAALKPATPAPRTCSTCPFFDSHNDGTDRGWCTQFDRFARESHPETQDCLNQGKKELTEQEAGEAWASFTVAAQVGDTFEIPGSPKAVVIDRYYRAPNELVFSVVLPDHKGDTLSWVLPMEPATEEVEQEWQTAQDEVIDWVELRKDIVINTIFDLLAEYDFLNYAHQVARDWLALAEKVKGDLLDDYAWRERYSQIRFSVKRLGLCNSEAEESLISVLQAAANDLIVEKMGGVTQLLGEQVEVIAPEPVTKHAENVYRVLSSEGTHRYQVNLYKGTCTCLAGSWYRPCRHIGLAKDKQRQETEAQMLNKLPSGWREKQVVHTTPAGKETQTWFYNSKGHRTNVMPV